MDLKNISDLLTALVALEAVKFGMIILAGYAWLHFQEKKEK